MLYLNCSRTLSPLLVPSDNLSESGKIAQELQLFHQLHPNAVDAVIMDDALEPFLKPGDFVAGQRYMGKEMENGIGSICIVQTIQGNTLVRLVRASTEVEFFTLACLNPNTSVDHPVIEDIQPLSIAPILWIRRAVIRWHF